MVWSVLWFSVAFRYTSISVDNIRAASHDSLTSKRTNNEVNRLLYSVIATIMSWYSSKHNSKILSKLHFHACLDSGARVFEQWKYVTADCITARC